MAATDWANIAPATICVETMLTRDAYGKPATFAAVQTFNGRRVYKTQRVASSANGQAVDVLSASVIWILGTPTIGLDDRVYVQGETTYPPVVAVDQPTDKTGAKHHTKVYLGSFRG